MENQHRKINGYRELNQEEIDLMNEIKSLGPQIEAVILKVQDHIKLQRDSALPVLGVQTEEAKNLAQHLNDATPERFAAMAKTEFQTGLMYLVRAVAQPETF